MAIQYYNANSVQVKHISEVTNDLIRFVERRREGVERSLKTRWDKLNKLTMGGFEPNSVTTIAGMSGSGKSALGLMLETDIIDLNGDQDIVVLSFSLEMLSLKQIGRRLSGMMKVSTRRLYSADEPLEDGIFYKMLAVSKDIRQYPIYYIDKHVNVDEIKQVVEQFQNGIAKNKWLIIFIDHVLLVNAKGDEGERQTIIALEKYLIEAKKIGKTTIFQLAQLNRDIEKSERINNPTMHYPMRSDLSSSDAMFQASDYVFVIHRPEILHIFEFGVDGIPTKDMVFIFCLKQREGNVGILKFENDLAYNNLIETK
jgi:replicative DNA helicase